MRKSILLLVPALVISFTACSKKQAAKVKAAVGNATNDNGSKKAAASSIDNQIQKDIKELHDLGVTSMDEGFKALNSNFAFSLSDEQRQKAIKLANSIKGQAEEMKKAVAKQEEGEKKNQQAAKAEAYYQRAISTITGLERSGEGKGLLNKAGEVLGVK